MKNIMSATTIIGSIFLATGAQGQTDILPDQVRALSMLCSSGASVKFQGELEGGLNRIFGKVLAGKGELELSKNETEFLNSFSDEGLKIEARKVYNDCAIEALKIVYNKRENQEFGENNTTILVPNSLVEIQKGQKFALKTDMSVALEGGVILTTQANYRVPETLEVRLSKGPWSSRDTLRLGDIVVFQINRGETECAVSYYARRQLIETDGYVYSLIYTC